MSKKLEVSDRMTVEEARQIEDDSLRKATLEYLGASDDEPETKDKISGKAKRLLEGEKGNMEEWSKSRKAMGVERWKQKQDGAEAWLADDVALGKRVEIYCSRAPRVEGIVVKIDRRFGKVMVRDEQRGETVELSMGAISQVRVKD